MMDLKEAAASIDYYTNRFDLACALYSHAVETSKQLENDEKLKGLVAPWRDIMDTAISDLNGLQREVLVLRSLIDRARAREMGRLFHVVDDFLALRNAIERNTLAFNKATELLNEHQKKLAEEKRQKELGSSRPKTPLQISIAEYRKERDQAEAEKRDKTMESSKPKTPLQLSIEEFNREKAAKNAVAPSPSEEFKRKYPGRNIRTQGES